MVLFREGLRSVTLVKDCVTGGRLWEWFSPFPVCSPSFMLAVQDVSLQRPIPAAMLAHADKPALSENQPFLVQTAVVKVSVTTKKGN